jgi:arsenite methyltransferase
MKILIICTGNSCRSQMAEGFLRHLHPELEIFSAGTNPATRISSRAVAVMQEIGIDIHMQVPENVTKYTGQNFDYVITVCDNAKETCPVFTGNVKHRLHMGFEDPYHATGSEEEILNVYRKVRDQIVKEFADFSKNQIQKSMETTNENLKNIVKEKYGSIAKSSSCCCCGDTSTFTVFSDDYKQKEGYVKDADLSLGCGIPTDDAAIKTDDTVLDLGSGAGNDCFVARALVGPQGHVIGIDFTDEMIEKARKNVTKLGFSNIRFVKGDIENMPIDNSSIDVVISNCVLNLVPDKVKAFSEIYRVLKTSGHFCVSDVVLRGELPEQIKEAAVMYAGCVSGAVQHNEYMDIIKNAGFKNIAVRKEKAIVIEDAVLLQYLSAGELEEFKKSNVGIYSITVYADKN